MYGLSIDAMVAAEVVTADGELLRCSENENADLFWCLRGGCGNFGVVTAFEFRPKKYSQAMPSLTRVHLPVAYCPLPSRNQLVRHFRDVCEGLPRTTSPILICTPFPIIECYYEIGGGDGGALRPLMRFGRPVVNSLKTRDYVNEISWDILGPSSSENLAGSYYPTSALWAAAIRTRDPRHLWPWQLSC